MIPRYQPNLDISAWLNWLASASSQDTYGNHKAKFLTSLQQSVNFPQVFAFEKGRQALYAYFKYLAQTVKNGNVLISAQICPVVPYLLKELGFTVRFVDSDFSYPTPSAHQYLQAIDEDTVAIAISPLYGYLQAEWQPLLERLNKIKLILDLAQGLGFKEQIADLVLAADAVVYSFGLGKGLDTGGGVLVAKESFSLVNYKVKISKKYYTNILVKSLALRMLIYTGLYPFFIQQLDATVERDKKALYSDYLCEAIADDDIYILWNGQIANLINDIQRAQKRAVELGTLPKIAQACRDISVFCNPNAVHLRQIIRFKDIHLKVKVLNSLRQKGIECLSAGEPLPQDYYTMTEQKDFPNARLFRDSSLRLPFLGRLSEAQFNQLKVTLEDAIAQHLSD